ncbi:MAG: phosphatase PAP2 family protein [Candidatus Elarobacter sp.]
MVAVTAAGCAAGATALGREVAEGDTLRVDRAVLDAIHGHASPLLDRFAAGVTFMGGPGVAVVALALVAVVFLRGERRTAAILAAGLVLSEVLDLVLKALFDRTRPELWLHPNVMGDSFPSGHALASTVVYGLVAWAASRALPRYGALFGALAALAVTAISLSRLYLGVHWPSDVVAGVAIGYLCLTATVAVARFAERRAITRQPAPRPVPR